MKATKFVVHALAAGVYAAAIAAPALADPPDRPGWNDGRHQSPPNSHGHGYGHSKGPRGNGQVPPGHLPELDPGLASSAALLLVGGTLVLRGRRRLEPQA